MKQYITQVITIVLLTVNMTVSAQKTTFALLTDMHIDIQKTSPSEDLTLAIDEINSTNEIDFIVVTGDVTDKGDSLSLVEAKRLLDKLKRPYYISFGNHDVLSSTYSNRVYMNVFGRDQFSFQHRGIQFIGFSTYPEHRVGQGHCSKADLSWLDTNLMKLEKQTPILILTHYPLQKGDVENWHQLLDILRKYNVQAVLNGHYHRNALLNFNEIPGIVNRSLLGFKKNQGAYTLYQLDNHINVYEKKKGLEPEQWLQIPIEFKNYQ